MRHLIRPPAAIAALALAGLALAALGGGPGLAGEPPKVWPDVAAALQSQREVPVIVSLHDPAPAAWRAQARRAQIAAAQERVLAALPAGAFLVTHRPQVTAAVAGVATQPAIEALDAQPDVVAVSLDRPLLPSLTQSGPLINADDVHAMGYTGAGVVVAVLDTGIDTDHPDLSDDLAGEACFLSSPNVCPPPPHPAEDGNGHGTLVSGIITGAGSVAPLGVAPDASIFAYKVLPNIGPGSSADVLAAMDDIAANHPEIDVINMSLGDGGSYPPGSFCDGLIPAMTDAFASAVALEMMIFVSSGNDASKSGISYPACLSDAASVGATYDASFGSATYSVCSDTSPVADQVACFSNSHPDLSLLAPGVLITTAYAGGGSFSAAGTSAAAPHATAVAALVRQASPPMPGTTVIDTMKSTGVPVTDAANGVTTPRVDALAAVEAALAAGLANFDGDILPYGNATSAIDNGPGIAGDDGTVPNSDTVEDSADPDDDNDGLPDADELSPTACTPFDLSTTTHPNPARGDNTNLDGDGPSWDTDGDGVLDGVECDLGTNPRDAGSKPTAAQCGGTMTDADNDGLSARAERCKWGTSDTSTDSDGDGRSDCVEANDTNGDGAQNFPGDTINSAKAAFSLIVGTMDFDLNGDGVVNFPSDTIFSAKMAFGVAPIVC